jgi:hypothetical protein
MRRGSVSALAIAALLAGLLGGPAAAQDKPADNMELLREKARTDKKIVVASALELTEGEAKAFWPVYNAYQSDMVTHYDRLLKLINDYGKAYGTMSDETAAKLLGDYLSLESSYVSMMKAYVPRFQKVLPATKVARLYQVENKLRALLNYDLARTIPLAK